uniref:HXXEE domain-containing protein n=1 Tax=Ignavibacterium album TaxID=591197 RepID=A0A832G0V8_9BACT
MNDPLTLSVKLIFLLGFTLHNIEEAIWLPEWSKYAKKFHEPVNRNQFVFAVIVVTIIGYLVTVAEIIENTPGSIFSYIYLGFIGMMGLNAIFPHLISTFLLKRYAPGLVTAMFLNLPLSIIIITRYLNADIGVYSLILAILLVSGTMLLALKPLFKAGKKLINFSAD